MSGVKYMETVVFTLNVNRFHREVAEKACERGYLCRRELREYLEKQAKGSEEEDGETEIAIYKSVAEFCEYCNDESISLINLWVGYAEVEDV